MHICISPTTFRIYIQYFISPPDTLHSLYLLDKTRDLRFIKHYMDMIYMNVDAGLLLWALHINICKTTSWYWWNYCAIFDVVNKCTLKIDLFQPNAIVAKKCVVYIQNYHHIWNTIDDDLEIMNYMMSKSGLIFRHA